MAKWHARAKHYKGNYKGRKKFVVTGDKKLDKQLRELPNKLRAKIQRSVLRKAAKIVLDDARANVPKKTGVLKKSLVIRALKKSKNKDRAGMRVLTTSPYARFVEFGTIHKGARPFLIPAMRRNASRVKATIKEGIKKAVDEAVRELR